MHHGEPMYGPGRESALGFWRNLPCAKQKIKGGAATGKGLCPRMARSVNAEFNGRGAFSQPSSRPSAPLAGFSQGIPRRDSQRDS